MVQYEFDRQELAAAVKAAATPIPRSPFTPMFGGVLVETTNNSIRFVGTDLATTVETRIPLDVKDDTRVVVADAKLFSTGLGKMRSDIVTLAIDSDTLSLRGDRNDASFKFQLIAADDWPREDLGEVVGTIEDTHALGLVAKAAATDDTRPVLKAVRFEAVGPSLVAVATDNYRLHSYAVGAADEGMQPFLVGLDAIEAAVRFVKNEPLTVLLGSRSVRFVGGPGISVASLLVDGAYPAWRNLQRKESTFEVSMETDSLVRAIEAARLAAGVNPIAWRFGNGSVIVAGEGQGQATAQTELPADGAVEALGTVKIRAGYLLDAIAYADSPLVTFGIEEATKPIVVGNGGLIMPARW